jgi:biopolymer transport protein ExbB/TolQ
LKKRVSPGWSIVIGIVLTLIFGTLGAFAWLAWVWSATPEAVRATVSSTRRGVVITVASVTLAASLVGVIMTVVSIVHSFDAISAVDPSDKARMLANGISNAMNWTVIGMLPMPIAVVVAFVSGYRLLRATQEGA